MSQPRIVKGPKTQGRWEVPRSPPPSSVKRGWQGRQMEMSSMSPETEQTESGSRKKGSPSVREDSVFVHFSRLCSREAESDKLGFCTALGAPRQDRNPFVSGVDRDILANAGANHPETRPGDSLPGRASKSLTELQHNF